MESFIFFRRMIGAMSSSAPNCLLHRIRFSLNLKPLLATVHHWKSSSLALITYLTHAFSKSEINTYSCLVRSRQIEISCWKLIEQTIHGSSFSKNPNSVGDKELNPAFCAVEVRNFTLHSLKTLHCKIPYLIEYHDGIPSFMSEGWNMYT